LLTLDEVGERLRLNRRSVERRIAAGLIPALKTRPANSAEIVVGWPRWRAVHPM
jgi:hypothetical protein